MLMEGPMRGDRTAGSNSVVALRAIEDEVLVSRSCARLLITAATAPAVETIARRIHAGMRAEFPFVRTSAGDLPITPRMLRTTCSNLLDAATGGSLLVSDVETMPLLVQEEFIELLEELALARAPAAAVRLISGTTVPLVDRVAAGRFSERLFYRLNTLHFVADRLR